MSCSLFVRTFLKSRKGGNLKKSLLAVFLLMIMLLSGTLTAYAEGSGNVDGGGGGLNQGTKAYNWPGNSYQGVRVTVVDAESGGIVAGPMDFTVCCGQYVQFWESQQDAVPQWSSVDITDIGLYLLYTR